MGRRSRITGGQVFFFWVCVCKELSNKKKTRPSSTLTCPYKRWMHNSRSRTLLASGIRQGERCKKSPAMGQKVAQKGGGGPTQSTPLRLDIRPFASGLGRIWHESRPGPVPSRGAESVLPPLRRRPAVPPFAFVCVRAHACSRVSASTAGGEAANDDSFSHTTPNPKPTAPIKNLARQISRHSASVPLLCTGPKTGQERNKQPPSLCVW